LLIPRQRLDLDDPSAVNSLGSFENVIVNHFRPSAPLWYAIPGILRSGGRLMRCAFNLRQHERDGTPAEFCLRVAEYATAQPDLTLLQYESFIDQGRFLDGYVFEKS
jgi:hypothetical protein